MFYDCFMIAKFIIFYNLKYYIYISFLNPILKRVFIDDSIIISKTPRDFQMSNEKIIFRRIDTGCVGTLRFLPDLLAKRLGGKGGTPSTKCGRSHGRTKRKLIDEDDRKRDGKKRRRVDPCVAQVTGA